MLIENLKTMALVVIAGMAAYALVRAAYSWDPVQFLFAPFQFVEFYVSYGLTVLFGGNAEISPTYSYTMIYHFADEDPDIRVASACTAVAEIALISAVLMVYRGPKLKKRFIWAGIFSGVIFIENIIRITLNYPLWRYLGEDGWNEYHLLWFKYGQLVVVLVLLGLYVAVIARKEISEFHSGRRGGGGEQDPRTEDPGRAKAGKAKKARKGSE
jgi:exosortase/archaeosortase family protein